jgi:hypothetical protein
MLSLAFVGVLRVSVMGVAFHAFHAIGSISGHEFWFPAHACALLAVTSTRGFGVGLASIAR